MNHSNRKGIILAGGKGTRLFPITSVISKQLLPVYDKPMIYYPLSTLMLAGINKILIITTKKDKILYQNLLGTGKKWGISIEYKVQNKPEGIAQALIIGSDFINNMPITLILGDNIFHGDGLSNQLQNASNINKGSTVFTYHVADPETYGVVNFDKNKKVIGIEEKPNKPKSNYALTGIYFYDKTVVEKAKKLLPSKRGELEITDINKMYLDEGDLNVEIMTRGMTWFDTGTFDSLHEASNFIQALENRQGFKISCPEEIAWRMGWINDQELEDLAKIHINNDYGSYLLKILKMDSKKISLK